MKNRSRLSRRLEEKSKKTLFFTLAGIILVLYFVFKVGIPLLVNFSLSVKGKDLGINNSKNKSSYVAPPVLDFIPVATNSAKTNISGKGIHNQMIKLYLNGNLQGEAKVDFNGVFNFENVILQSGQNHLKAKANSTDNQESEFSSEVTITFKEQKLSLSIDFPSDNQTFSKDDNFITIIGKTDVGNKITVNGFWAIVDENGNYSYKLALQSGDNKIHVVATDDAGNRAEMEKKATYNK